MKIPILFIIPLFIYMKSFSQNPKNNPNWELAFNEEFDSTHINKTKWKSIYNWNQTGLFNVDYCLNVPYDTIDNETVGYRMRNFENCLLDTSSSGLLKIVSKKENYFGEIWDWPRCISDSCLNLSCDSTLDPPRCFFRDTLSFNYTTNMLISREWFKYGYFEIRCKLPNPTPPMTNAGIGPNFWLFSGDVISPWSEIDIFEFNGALNGYASNIHLENIYGDTIHGIESPFLLIDFSQFHTFAINWTPEKIDFYIDDSIYHSFTDHVADLDTMPMIIDVNLPLHTMCQFVDSIYTQFPHYFEIDYVKVFQLKSDCNSNYDICNYNNIVYKHYNTINIGGINCNFTIPQNDSLYLTYSNKINIHSNFILQQGAKLIFEQYPCFESVHVFPGKYDDLPHPAPKSFFKRNQAKYHRY